MISAAGRVLSRATTASSSRCCTSSLHHFHFSLAPSRRTAAAATNSSISPWQMQIQMRLFHHSDENLDTGDLDELCTKHMQIPEEDFAEGCRFLHQIGLGKYGEVEKIVSKHPSIVNFRDYDRRTPLHIAASEGKLGLCQLLVENGARINRSDRWSNSPLDDAIRHRHLDCAEYLQSIGGKFGSMSQATNFITAASEGDLAEVQTCEFLVCYIMNCW
jgi:ankyrin repeat protein